MISEELFSLAAAALPLVMLERPAVVTCFYVVTTVLPPRFLDCLTRRLDALCKVAPLVLVSMSTTTTLVPLVLLPVKELLADES